MRAEIGRPLQHAEALIGKQRFGEALARIKDAEAAGPRDANEKYLVERMRISAALGAGDPETAGRSLDALEATGLLPGGEALRMMEAIAGGYYRARQYGKVQQWVQRYLQKGGTNPAMRTLLVQSRYLDGDYAGVVKALTTGIEGFERKGVAPPEDRLQLLLSASAKTNDSKARDFALRRLVIHYPKPDYWREMLNRLQNQHGFPSRLALDVWRLRLATGSLTRPDDYMEMAQGALQADLPGEAAQVIDKGFASGALGTGANAERHERLRRLIEKRSKADDAARAETLERAMGEPGGDALLKVGSKLVYDGQAAKGVQLMQQAIARAGLKQPEQARLHLGLAQLAAGDKAAARATFKSLEGEGAVAELARLWLVHLRNG